MINKIPTVTLVRTRFNDVVDRVELLAPEAVYILLNSPDNGTIYKSGRIEWGDVIDNWSSDIGTTMMLENIRLQDEINSRLN